FDKGDRAYDAVAHAVLDLEEECALRITHVQAEELGAVEQREVRRLAEDVDQQVEAREEVEGCRHVRRHGPLSRMLGNDPASWPGSVLCPSLISLGAAGAEGSTRSMTHSGRGRTWSRMRQTYSPMMDSISMMMPKKNARTVMVELQPGTGLPLA